jgi:thiosulfate/3-mercaptopyruvate sulfurtransferase
MHPLVSPAWLAARLDDPVETLATVILDATLPPVGVTPAPDTHARYLEQHLPGALFFDIEALSDHATSLPHMLPTPESFAASMAALGVSDTMTIVVYEQAGVFSAPRARWMLRTFGAQQVFLLDGGLAAWVAAGLPVESGPVTGSRAEFHATLDREAVKDFTHIQQEIADGGQILDARPAGRFNGTAPEPRPGLSSGHMPGAISMPAAELVAAGRLKSADALRKVFAERRVKLDAPITTTCGSGVTAAVVALGLEIIGATQISLYDGSWAEYAQHPEAVIEKTLPSE